MKSYLCPVCRAPRNLELKNELGILVHIKIFLTTLAICAFVYLTLGMEAALKTSPTYLILWGLTECVHWIQMRSLAKCQVCNFDPILYRQDWRKARSQIEARLNTQLEHTKQQRAEHFAFFKGQNEGIKKEPSAPHQNGLHAISPSELSLKRGLENDN